MEVIKIPISKAKLSQSTGFRGAGPGLVGFNIWGAFIDTLTTVNL